MFFGKPRGHWKNRIWSLFPGIFVRPVLLKSSADFLTLEYKYVTWKLKHPIWKLKHPTGSIARLQRPHLTPKGLGREILGYFKKNLGWWNTIPFGQIWMFLENPLWREKSGVCFLEKKNGLNGTNKFIYLEGMVYEIRWLLQCIRIISTWWQLNFFKCSPPKIGEENSPNLTKNVFFQKGVGSTTNQICSPLSCCQLQPLPVSRNRSQGSAWRGWEHWMGGAASQGFSASVKAVNLGPDLGRPVTLNGGEKVGASPPKPLEKFRLRIYKKLPRYCVSPNWITIPVSILFQHDFLGLQNGETNPLCI